MLDKVEKAFAKMGRVGLYARMDFGENAAAATPLLTGKAMRLVREGQTYYGIVLFSQDDRTDFDRTGKLKIHFSSLPKEGMSSEELARMSKEVGIATQYCLNKEGLQVEWNGLPDQNLLVTGATV